MSPVFEIKGAAHRAPGVHIHFELLGVQVLKLVHPVCAWFFQIFNRFI